MEQSGFVVWNAEQPSDAERWGRLWAASPSREVFAHPRYASLFAGRGVRAFCAAIEAADGGLLYPFLLRDLEIEPYWSPELPRATDMISPYGYGGVYGWGPGIAEVAPRVWVGLDRWMRERRVVSEFVRFPPLPDHPFSYPGQLREAASNVVLTLDPDRDPWPDFAHKVRKNANTALRHGVSVSLDPVGERLDDFLDVYRHTMDRRHATAGYDFPRTFFEAIHRELGGGFVYFHAVHEGEVVSSELVLVSEENVYSFLGGTRQDKFHLRPNDLLKVEIIAWARQEHKRRYILGGGYKPLDGIFRYKLSFAPRGEVPFVVGQRVLDGPVYQSLIERRRAWEGGAGRQWAPRPDFFPAYRS